MSISEADESFHSLQNDFTPALKVSVLFLLATMRSAAADSTLGPTRKLVSFGSHVQKAVSMTLPNSPARLTDRRMELSRPQFP